MISSAGFMVMMTRGDSMMIRLLNKVTTRRCTTSYNLSPPVRIQYASLATITTTAAGSTSHHQHHQHRLSVVNKEWTQTVSRAEKVVGHSTSLQNLRYLISDEMANFANLFRKLIKTKHPLISLVNRLNTLNEETENNNNNTKRKSLQINGVIVLLIAKAAGIPSTMMIDTKTKSDISEGILKSQRSLAEITEMIYIGSLIHRGIVNLSEGVDDSVEWKQMDQGNKLAVLCGDYLLASACNNLSKLKNSQVVGLMSEVIADVSQSKFPHDDNKEPSLFVNKWYEKINSTTSILVSNSAKAALLLVSHSPRLQETAWHLAKHLNLAYQVWSDLIEMVKQDRGGVVDNQEDTLIYAVYKDRYTHSGQSSQQENVPKAIISSSCTSLDAASQLELINDCKLIFTEHYQLAMSRLDELESGGGGGDRHHHGEQSEREEAITSLRSILNVMKDTI